MCRELCFIPNQTLDPSSSVQITVLEAAFPRFSHESFLTPPEDARD